MAYTEIHPLTATVHKAVAYICNPEKTDDKLLVSSFGCAPETAHHDFAFARQNAAIQSPNLAYHLIQAFKPGEVLPEEAHKIGQELADNLLKEKYSYVVSTHIDKGHVHNHIIFSSVDNEKYEHYNDCTKSYWYIRNLSDNLCREHGLSVIEKHSGKRGKSWWQWNLAENGDPKVQLKRDIDKCIKLTDTYEEFLQFMQAKGYRIKEGKYISFGLPGSSQFVRGKERTLGKKYTKEKIQERITNKSKVKTRVTITRLQYLLETPIDMLQNSENDRMRKWATKENLKRMAETYNQMVESGLHSLEELDFKIEQIKEQKKELKSSVKQLAPAYKNLTEMNKYLEQYLSTKAVYGQYQKAYFRDRYFQKHEREIIIHGAAINYFKQQGIDPSKLNIDNMSEKIQQLSEDKEHLQKRIKELDKQDNRLQLMKDNLKGYLQIEDREKSEKAKSVER
ncbi:MAG: relaxase/mobilization nuclease domain-containing protein [Lachnospiraceae bacterium]